MMKANVDGAIKSVTVEHFEIWVKIKDFFSKKCIQYVISR